MDPILSPSSGNISAAVIEQLSRTKGWTRFFSVLLWIGAGFFVLGGIAMFGFGAFAGAAGSDMPDQFAAMGGGIVLGVVYLVMSVVYIYPALKLGNFSSRITDLMAQPSEAHLVAALNEQRAFWKYVGIWMIVFIALYPIIIIAAVALPALSGQF
ncbi:MAG: DUF5362 family protein [Verrucomicrobiota bacterium]